MAMRVEVVKHAMQFCQVILGFVAGHPVLLQVTSHQLSHKGCHS